VVVEPEDVDVLEDVVVDEPGDVEAVVELDEVDVEDDGVLDELEDDVDKIVVDKVNNVVVDESKALDEEVTVGRVEEEVDELDEADNSETKVTVLISELW
jgi:hypothetical protein